MKESLVYSFIPLCSLEISCSSFFISTALNPSRRSLPTQYPPERSQSGPWPTHFLQLCTSIGRALLQRRRRRVRPRDRGFLSQPRLSPGAADGASSVRGQPHVNALGVELVLAVGQRPNPGSTLYGAQAHGALNTVAGALGPIGRLIDEHRQRGDDRWI